MWLVATIQDSAYCLSILFDWVFLAPLFKTGLCFHWISLIASTLHLCWLPVPFSLSSFTLPWVFLLPSKKRSAPLFLYLSSVSSGYWVPRMSSRTGEVTVNMLLRSSWKVGTGRKGKMFWFPPLTHHCPKPISSAYSECFLFFLSFYTPSPSTLSSCFHPFVGTMFYRMSWCTIYCTYHSGFWTAADTI